MFNSLFKTFFKGLTGGLFNFPISLVAFLLILVILVILPLSLSESEELLELELELLLLDDELLLDEELEEDELEEVEDREAVLAVESFLGEGDLDWLFGRTTTFNFCFCVS